MNLLRLLDLLGVAVFAVSGALAAGRKHLDLMGVLVLAVVTAVGGGTLRDLLLSRHPVFWMADPAYLVVSVFAAALTVLYTQYRAAPQRTLLVADALGLALFAVSGAQIAEAQQLHAIIVVVMGTMTGVAGGMLRDVLVNDIPMIIREGEVYATAAVIGVVLYLGLQGLGVTREAAALSGMATIALIRLAAIVWDISLPLYRLPPE